MSNFPLVMDESPLSEHAFFSQLTHGLPVDTVRVSTGSFSNNETPQQIRFGSPRSSNHS